MNDLTDTYISGNTFDPYLAGNVADAAIFNETLGGRLSILNNSFNQLDSFIIVCGDLDDSIISGNQMFGTKPGGTGITLSNCDHGIIIGNVIKGFGTNGIDIDNDSDGNTVIGNVCNTNTGWGVIISNANCNKNIVVGNYLAGNTAGGISDSGTGTVAANNVTS